MAWPSSAEAASGDGAFDWRDEAVQLSASVGSPLDLLAGRPSPLKLAVDSTPLHLSLEGTAANLDGFQFDGDATVATPSLRKLIDWTGGALGDGATLGPASIKGAVNWSGSSVSFSDAAIELDGNVAEGALAVAIADGRPGLQGTIAFETLDLSSYFQSFAAGLADGARAAATPVSLPLEAIGNIDLRISSNNVVVGPVTFGHSGGAINIKDGKLTVDVGEAEFQTGQIEAHLSAEMQNGALTGTLNASAADVAAGGALAEVAGLAAIDGVASATAEVTSHGTTLGELALNATGTGTLSIEQGTITGFAISSLRSPGAAAADPSSAATTAFKTLGGGFQLATGQVTTPDLKIEGDGYTIGIAGTAWLLAPKVEGRGRVSLAADGGTPATALDFHLGGTWAAPVVSPDPAPAGGAPAAAP